MDKYELQEKAEEILMDIETERGMPFHQVWRDTLLMLMKVHAVGAPAIHRIADTINQLDYEAGTLPAKPPFNLG